MATARQFVQELLRIPGIEGYCLVRPDGRVLVHNLEAAEETAALVLLCGQAGKTIRKGMGLQHFRHLALGRENSEHLLVFPVEQYLLGIIQSPEATTHDLVEALYHFLLRITRSSRDHAGGSPAPPLPTSRSSHAAT